MQQFRGFTIIEILIVVTLMAIILGITLMMGWNYLQTIQYRQEKEILIGSLDDMLSIARTSTYYQSFKFDYLDIEMGTGGYTGSVASGSNPTFGAGRLVESHSLGKSDLSFDGAPLQLRLTPYALGCEIVQGATGFQLDSTVSTHQTCFEVTTDVCKIKQVICP